MTIEISKISVENIRNNQFQNELREVYELKDVIENAAWHNHESVYKHTINVLETLEELFEHINPKIDTYLDQKIDNHTKRDMLFLGTLYHDIAKGDVLVEIDGVTSCPGHEELGFEKVKDILNRFDLSTQEKDIVANIVKYHGEMHAIIDPKNDKLDEQVDKFKLGHPDIYMELILLAMADTLGSQLKSNNPAEYKFRMDQYQRIIDNY